MAESPTKAATTANGGLTPSDPRMGFGPSRNGEHADDAEAGLLRSPEEMETEIFKEAEQRMDEKREIMHGRNSLWTFAIAILLLLTLAFALIIAVHYTGEGKQDSRTAMEVINGVTIMLVAVLAIIWLRYFFEEIENLSHIHATSVSQIHRLNKVLKIQVGSAQQAAWAATDAAETARDGGATGNTHGMVLLDNGTVVQGEQTSPPQANWDDPAPLPPYNKEHYHDLYQAFMDLKVNFEAMLPFAREHRDKCAGRKEKFHILKEKYDQKKAECAELLQRAGGGGGAGRGTMDASGELQSRGMALPQSPQRPVYGDPVTELNALKPAVGIVFVSGPRNGVLVKHVPADLPAFAAGLRVGDVVEEVNGVATYTKNDFKDALHNVRVGDIMALRVERNGDIREIQLNVGAHGYEPVEVAELRQAAAVYRAGQQTGGSLGGGSNGASPAQTGTGAAYRWNEEQPQFNDE
jgi:hypothetical protein